MHISKSQFDQAATAAAIPTERADIFWQELLRRSASSVGSGPQTRFDLAHLAYYFGALIVLGAMGWFMSNAWEAFGGMGIAGIAAVYGLLFALAGGKMWGQPGGTLRTAGGLLVTLAVGMMPLFIYGLERWAGWWPQDDPGGYANFHPYINGSWIVMELGTVVVGAVALWFVRFPFLTAPVAFALWFLSMDLAALLARSDELSWKERQWISVWFGLGILLVGFVVDVARHWQKPDYGFWLSLFGMLAFWGALTSMDSISEWNRSEYAAINVGLLVAGIVVNRRVCLVFGAIGVNIYLAHLAHDLFADSWLFPFVLSALGVGIIAAGVFYQRHQEAWRAGLLRLVPAKWHAYLPATQSTPGSTSAP